MWKKHYENNNLDKIIFKELTQPMNPNSLKAISEIAYRCLHVLREERPAMSHIVKTLEMALEHQVRGDLNLPKEYEEILKGVVPPLIYRSLDELKLRLSKGVHLNEGKTWLSLNMKGERCEMISIAQCLIPVPNTKSRYLSTHNSRFEVGCYEPSEIKLETRVRTQFLSTQITYTVNLVFKNKENEREDGWLMAELFQFTSDKKIVDLNILLDMEHYRHLLLEGIEFQPLENVEQEVSSDEKVKMEALDTDWKEKPETVHEDGETYLLLPTRAALEEKKWMSLHKTFVDVGHGSSRKFDICCEIESEKLPRETAYATYLIYKQNSNFRAQPPPAQVKDINSKSESHIYFGTPKTPIIIRGKVDEKTYNPSRRLKIKGIPKQRSNGWMEVQVWEFHTGTLPGTIPMNLKLSSYDKALEGIVVCGIEFRPI